MRCHSKFLVFRCLVVSALFLFAGISVFVPAVAGTEQNLTEHSWVYNQGTINEMRIYQSESGYNGQKLVVGTRGTGTVSRTIDASVYGGYEDENYNEIMFNEWGVYQNRPTKYAAPITKSDLKNALCAKNYEVGSVFSESYSELNELIKDTTIEQDISNSVYSVHSEVEGTMKVGARVQKSASSTPLYVMTGVYSGYTNFRMSMETGNASVLTLPCP